MESPRGIRMKVASSSRNGYVMDGQYEYDIIDIGGVVFLQVNFGQ